LTAVQQPPTAADLLAMVVEVLTDEVVPALTGPVQHQTRVAANLVAIVERELRLAGDTAKREHAAIAALLDVAIVDIDDEDGNANLATLRARLASELRAGMADDPTTNENVWRTLMAAVGDDLSIAKPGHDAWDGD
jgi:phosphoribosylcarboxyaminoimidazole (NCAIR) mutase